MVFNMQNITLQGKLLFFSPISNDDSTFVIPVYQDNQGRLWINAYILAENLGHTRQQAIKTVYSWINNCELKDHEDFEIRPPEDDITGQPEYLFKIQSARKVLVSLTPDGWELAVQFLDQAFDINDQDVFKIFALDTLTRAPTVPFDVVAMVFADNGYNDGMFSLEYLNKLLKRCKIITSRGNPSKGCEHYFCKVRDEWHFTTFGVITVFRFFMGMPIMAALKTLSQVMTYSSRLASDDLFEETRIKKLITERTNNEN